MFRACRFRYVHSAAFFFVGGASLCRRVCFTALCTDRRFLSSPKSLHDRCSDFDVECLADKCDVRKCRPLFSVRNFCEQCCSCIPY